VNPGWEIFFNGKLTFKETPTVVIKEIQEEVNWVVDIAFCTFYDSGPHSLMMLKF